MLKIDGVAVVSRPALQPTVLNGDILRLYEGEHIQRQVLLDERDVVSGDVDRRVEVAIFNLGTQCSEESGIFVRQWEAIKTSILSGLEGR